MTLEPRWSGRISKSGPPEQPLRADSVRNRMASTIAHGITTDVRARGRYFSGFCWAMHRINTDSSTASLSTRKKKRLLMGFEEVLALSSVRHKSQHGSIEGGLSGITGISNANNESFFESETIDLDSFSLLDSAYAISGFQTNLASFYLKSDEMALTPAGQTLAMTLDESAGPYFDRIRDSVQSGILPVVLLDDLVDAYSHQGSFASSAAMEERDALQRVILGIVRWDHDNQAATLQSWPSRLDIPVESHFGHILSEERPKNDLHDTIASNIHILRRAWCLAILRGQQLLSETDDFDELIEYEEDDIDRFEPFRSLGRTYFLQVQLAYALRAQLWGITEHLKHEAPRSVSRPGLLAAIRDGDNLIPATNTVLAAETSLTENQLSEGAIIRELLIAGSVTPRSYKISIPNSSDTSTVCTTLGELTTALHDRFDGGWHPVTSNRLSGWTLLRATRNGFDTVSNAATTGDSHAALETLLARSLVQIVAATERFRELTDGRLSLKRYMQTRFGQQPSSLMQTAEYLESLPEKTPLPEMAARFLDERVLDIHDQIVRDRLGNNSISMAFSSEAIQGELSGARRADHLYPAGGTPQPRTQSLRYTDLRRLMRDAGLLAYNVERELWEPTADGVTVLNRFHGESE